MGTDEKVRDEGNKTANEIAKGNGESADHGARLRRLGHSVVKVHQERGEHG